MVKGYKNNTAPIICKISKKEPTVRWDGVKIYTITNIVSEDKSHICRMYLNKPLFKITDGKVVSAGNLLVNVDDCNPDFLLLLADRIESGDLAYPDSIRERVVNDIRDALRNSYTPMDFYKKIVKGDLVFKDDLYPETYRLDPALYFESMAKQQILAFDVHDLLHHPLQLATWSKEFEYISLAGNLVHKLDDSSHKNLWIKKLVRLVWLVCFEESLIKIGNQITSFGCLNWLAPSEVPTNRIKDFSKISIADQVRAIQWHYIDALKELYKIQRKNSALFGQKLDWLERLGYRVEGELKNMIEGENPRPFEKLKLDDLDNLKFDAPTSAEELFQNAIRLIKEEL